MSWTPPHRRQAWNANVAVRATPERVLDALTDPAACARWSGIPFRLDELDGPRLRSGSRARLSGRIVGRELGFDVRVQHAGVDGLVLRAVGPVELAAHYRLRRVDAGCMVDASVRISMRRSRAALPVAGATAALLSAGALEHALRGLAREVECPGRRAHALRPGPAPRRQAQG
jgi:hypothetical protein